MTGLKLIIQGHLPPGWPYSCLIKRVSSNFHLNSIPSETRTDKLIYNGFFKSLLVIFFYSSMMWFHSAQIAQQFHNIFINNNLIENKS